MTLYDFLYDMSKSMTLNDRYDLVQTLQLVMGMMNSISQRHR